MSRRNRPGTRTLAGENVYLAAADKIYMSKAIIDTEDYYHESVNPEVLRTREPASADDILVRASSAPEEIPLKDSPDLPDSDLLAALHYYAANYYKSKGLLDNMELALDETALLALGIVVEEYIKKSTTSAKIT